MGSAQLESHFRAASGLEARHSSAASLGAAYDVATRGDLEVDALEQGSRGCRLAQQTSPPLVRAEALLLDRLEEFVATGHTDAFAQAILLLSSAAVDRKLLEQQAGRRQLAAALAKLDELAGEIASRRTFAAWELHRIADALLRSARVSTRWNG